MNTNIYAKIAEDENFQKLAKDKKLNTDVWYDKDTLNWVKASFEKKGKWVGPAVADR